MSTGIVLAVHGGAARLSKIRVRYPARRRDEQAIAASLRAGQRILLRGGSATRAVAAAVCVLEDHELYNAGRGAALCRDGSIELSASIMTGESLRVGAMVGLKRTRNPVLAAQSLLPHKHCMLFGEAGDDFAERAGLEMKSPDYFITAARRRQWSQRVRGEASTKDPLLDDGTHGTVGAVAMDRRGRLAAATSTGGLVNQLPGRVGDSPVVGAGTWANHVCAISATGKGDPFARMVFARRVNDLIELCGLSPDEAARRELAEVARLKGAGGCIVLTAEGTLAAPFTAEHMVRGWVRGDGDPRFAMGADDEVVIAD